MEVQVLQLPRHQVTLPQPGQLHPGHDHQERGHHDTKHRRGQGVFLVSKEKVPLKHHSSSQWYEEVLGIAWKGLQAYLEGWRLMGFERPA